ncbi:MAG TPA: 2,3-diaminopropionate biosynthesis protein SbnB [Thermoanaerobaculia bacterium]|nr:2,3-diaminopropionate biosynthesis protein SbnB [Thermoanaerobaculia bacterium]
MGSEGIVILKGDDVAALLKGREREVIEAVRKAYVAHSRGHSNLPHSSFLRFPNDDANRIIALPAFLGDGFDVAGLKWISSFPANVRKGTPRASAALLLNSTENGHVEAILESSLISAKRTAASAALAAEVLTAGRAPESVGLIGTGVINLEIVRFLRAALPGISRVTLFDLDPERAERFAGRVREIAPGVEVKAEPSLAAVLAGHPLVSFATTAIRPHVDDLSMCPPGATILHISLRDLTPEVVLACDNVVDDPDHVCRAHTSLHLAEQQTGNRDFIRCTLADICEGNASPRADGGKIAVFSPFGLGVLDLAVGKLALDSAAAAGRGTVIESFLPTDEGAV